MKLMSSSIAALTIFFFLLMPPVPAFSWNQEPHKQINFEAVKVFLNFYALSDMEKYRMGRFDRISVTEPYRGVAVTSKSLLIDSWMGYPPYQIAEATKTMPQWIAYGGDWADEPHLYSSVRHFYDPLAMWGYAYLTDQFAYHGWYDAPEVDARTWGLDHPANPFSFREALGYYKAAMEVPETWKPTGHSLFPYHFKLDIDFYPREPDDLRGIYLAMAYRALGEAMHMLGDMTQPAHVRNDSHPKDEPIEKALSSRDVRHAADYPIVDERIAPYLKSAGGTLHSPAEIFREVALFTNQNFYSLDTIYDAEENVIPNNIVLQQPAIPLDILMNFRPPYLSPQFKDLIEEKTLVSGWIRNTKREVKQLSGAFTVGKIPMTQQRLSLYWFDPDMETLEMVARLKGLGPYHIPPSYAEKKSWVLMPVAIHACADLMHHLFPSMELKAGFTDLGIQEDAASGADEYKRTVIDIDTEMLHHHAQDMAWSQYNLEVKYSGPALLVSKRGDQVVKTRDLHFLNGRLHKIESHEGEMVQKPLKVYIASRDIALIPEEAFYEVQNGDTLYLEVEAGSRSFRSEEYVVERETDVYITNPSRRLIYELSDGATGVDETVEFRAEAMPEGAYRFDWDFGDGSNVVSQNKKAGEASTVSHTFKNLKNGDAFYPSVSLYSADGILLAEDAITIKITVEDAGAWVMTHVTRVDTPAPNIMIGSNTKRQREYIPLTAKSLGRSQDMLSGNASFENAWQLPPQMILGNTPVRLTISASVGDVTELTHELPKWQSYTTIQWGAEGSTQGGQHAVTARYYKGYNQGNLEEIIIPVETHSVPVSPTPTPSPEQIRRFVIEVYAFNDAGRTTFTWYYKYYEDLSLAPVPADPAIPTP